MTELKALTTEPKADDVAQTLRILAGNVEVGVCVVTRLDLFQSGTLDFEMVVRGYAVPVKRVEAWNGEA